MRVELPVIDALLCKWGLWSLRCQSAALGFASMSILACTGEHHNVDGLSHSTLPHGLIDGDMEQMDGAIRKLPKVLRITVVEIYQFGHGKSDRKLAASLGIHVDTMRKYVLLAHRKIALDISEPCAQNSVQSVNGGITPQRNIQPATA